jgi:transposase
MQIVSALDVHRRQITYKTLELASGQIWRGRISPPAREPVREWLERFAGQDAHFALEGTTGWRFVVEEIERAGHVAHLADPADTAARRGRKRRAKTDDADCDLQLELLLAGVARVVDPARADPRVAYAGAVAQDADRSAHGLAAAAAGAALPPGRAGGSEAADSCGAPRLATVELTASGSEVVRLALRMLGTIDRELAPLDRTLHAFARRQPGCRALTRRLYGVGAVTATAIVAELGDARRFTSSDDAVRHAGLDVTVYHSDRKRAAGHLSHQGPALLRWALFEAAQCAARRSSPDHSYYLDVAQRIDHNRACLSVARKLCRRAHHILRELEDDALAAIDEPALTKELVDAAA